MNEKRIVPFSNGTEYMDWQDRNCWRCTKAWTEEMGGDPGPCDIDNALGVEGQVTGDIPLAIAHRAGWDGMFLAADCPERELVIGPHP